MRKTVASIASRNTGTRHENPSRARPPSIIGPTHPWARLRPPHRPAPRQALCLFPYQTAPKQTTVPTGPTGENLAGMNQSLPPLIGRTRRAPSGSYQTQNFSRRFTRLIREPPPPRGRRTLSTRNLGSLLVETLQTGIMCSPKSALADQGKVFSRSCRPRDCDSRQDQESLTRGAKRRHLRPCGN